MSITKIQCKQHLKYTWYIFCFSWHHPKHPVKRQKHHQQHHQKQQQQQHLNNNNSTDPRHYESKRYRPPPPNYPSRPRQPIKPVPTTLTTTTTTTFSSSPEPSKLPTKVAAKRPSQSVQDATIPVDIKFGEDDEAGFRIRAKKHDNNESTDSSFGNNFGRSQTPLADFATTASKMPVRLRDL